MNIIAFNRKDKLRERYRYAVYVRNLVREDAIPYSRSFIVIKNQYGVIVRFTGFHKYVVTYSDSVFRPIASDVREKGEHSAKELLRTAYRHHKRVSHRNARKHSTKTAKFNTEPSSRGPRHGNSAAAKKSRSKEMQKRRIKRQYADTTRKARKSVRLIAKSTTKVKLIANKAAAALANPKVLAVIGIVLLVVVIISGLVAITTGIAGEFVQSVVNLSYLADDECIDDAALYYSELEVDMRWSIINVQDEHPDYDEYRFSIHVLAAGIFVQSSLIWVIPQGGHLQKI